MGAIDYSVDRICRTIPADILQYCYIDRYDWRNRYPRSVEDIITHWVIRKRVSATSISTGDYKPLSPLMMQVSLSKKSPLTVMFSTFRWKPRRDVISRLHYPLFQGA